MFTDFRYIGARGFAMFFVSYLQATARLTNIAVIARTSDLVNNIIQQMLRLQVFVFKDFLSSSKSMNDWNI